MFKKYNCYNELIQMRKNYYKKPIKEIDACKPQWLEQSDNILNELYDKPNQVLLNTIIHYGCILQANTLLYEKEDPRDCPATFLLSSSEYVNQNPQILEDIANDIYKYKHTELVFVPDDMKTVVRYIQDEYDSTRLETSITLKDGTQVTIYVITLMVLRKHLPEGYLTKRIYPVLTNYETSNTAMILPYKYWTKATKKLL